MTGYYIANCDMSNLKTGVVKKILSQVNAIDSAGIDCSIIGTTNYYNNKLFGKVFSRFLFFPIQDDWKNIHITDNIDFIYIRKPYFDIGFYNFLKNSKSKYPNLKIVLELPTFPYDAEYSVKTYPFKVKDRFWRKKLHKKVDLITTYSLDKYIWRISALHIINGIDFESIQVRNCSSNKSNELHLVAVAGMYKWHGYDRLIKGLRNYYSGKYKTKVYLHLVGEGSESEYYKQLTHDYGLQDYVIFHGKLFGSQLDDVYDICNIAIEGLASHRKELFLSSSLKSREYVAKGFPIVTACEIDAFPSDEFDFVLRTPSDESSIDVSKIITFYEGLKVKYLSEKDLAKSIRSTGQEICDISITMRPVIDYLEFNSNQ